MTLGQLVECVTGKCASQLGFFCDATPFTSFDSENIYDLLENECGYSRHGDEVLYSGINGKQLSTRFLLVQHIINV